MRSAWRWGLTAWVLLAVITWVAALVSPQLLEQGVTVSPPGYETPDLDGAAEVIGGPWLKADALWYLKVAEQGYDDSGSYAFLPAFPLAVAGLSRLGIEPLFAALLVSHVSTALGLVALFGFLGAMTSEKGARAGVVGLALFPTSFFFIAPYAESVLMASGSAALLFCRRGKWWAAPFAAVASVSRPFGVLLVLPLLAIALSGRKFDLKRLSAAAAAAAGYAMWMFYVYQKTGDLLGALRVQGLWQRRPQFFGSTLIAGAREAGRWLGTENAAYFIFDLVAALFGLMLVAAAFVALKRGSGGILVAVGVSCFGLAALLIPFSYPFPPRPLMSVPRFVLALFPLFAGYALIHRRLRAPLAVISGVGLAVATAVFVGARPLF